VASIVGDAVVNSRVAVGPIRVVHVDVVVRPGAPRPLYDFSAATSDSHNVLLIGLCVILAIGFAIWCVYMARNPSQQADGNRSLRRRNPAESSSAWRFGRVTDASKQGDSNLDSSYDLELDSARASASGLTLTEKARGARRDPLPALTTEGIANGMLSGSGIIGSGPTPVQGSLWACPQHVVQEVECHHTNRVSHWMHPKLTFGVGMHDNV